MDPNRKRNGADRVDRSASVTAGAVGTAFGAAKLRDAFAEEHPTGHAKAVAGLHTKLQGKLTPAAATRVGQVLEHGKPGFTPLAVGTGAAALAAGAGRYSDHVKRAQAKEARRMREAQARKAEEPVAKSAFGVEHPHLIEKAKRGKGFQAPAQSATSNRPGQVGAVRTAPKAKRRRPGRTSAPAAVSTSTPAATTTAPAAEETVGRKMRAAAASPSMPKAEQIYDEVRGALKSPGKLVRHGPTMAAIGGGLVAGALIHRHHQDSVSKSAFGVTHPEEELAKSRLFPYGAPELDLKGKAKTAGKAAAKAAKGHGAYIAGAAGVGSLGAVGAIAGNRARKAAPAVIDRKIAAKFPVPHAGPAIALGGAGVLAAGALAHNRRKSESLEKSAFGVEHAR